MLDPGSSFSSNSYEDLRRRLLMCLRSEKIDDQVMDLLNNGYRKALATEGVVLSRPERKRIMTDVLKSVLADLSKRIDEGRIPD